MVKTFSEVFRLPEFERDLIYLLKRYRTLENDLNVFIEKELYLYHRLRIDNKGIFRISGLGFEKHGIYKAKKFACRSLKGKGVHSGIRVVYLYDERSDKVGLIEIYYKGDKETEDRDRISKLLKSKPN
jgi:hypothetical protein